MTNILDWSDYSGGLKCLYSVDYNLKYLLKNLKINF